VTLRRAVPWLLPALCGLTLLVAFMPPPSPGGMDLDAAGRLAVLNNGRVKPLDTVARTSLLMINGKQSFTLNGRRIGALDWLLDMAARPTEADAYQVIAIDEPDIVGMLGTQAGNRRRFAFTELAPKLTEIGKQGEQADAVPSGSRSRYQTAILALNMRLMLYQRLKNTIAPEGTDDFAAEVNEFRQVLAPGVAAVLAHQRGGGFDHKALGRLMPFFNRYQSLDQLAEYRPLAPLPGDGPDDWRTMGGALLESMKAAEPHPGVAAYAAMIGSWARQDPAGFNAAVAGHRAWQQARVPRAAALADAEVLFNRVEPFYLGMMFYVVALLAAFVAYLLWPEELRRAALSTLWLAFGVHTIGLISRIVLQGRPPVTNLYSSAVWVGWVAVGLGLELERRFRSGLGTIVAAVIGFATLIIAHHLALEGDSMEMMRAVLDSNFWLSTHVVAVTTGYSATFLAGTLAIVYLVRGALTRTLTPEAAATLSRMTYGVVCFALFFSFTGTVLGGIWADQSWGRFWGWDPKENGALLIVLWNAIILHARWAKMADDRGIMVMAVFGNIITSLSWFGVNMLGIGLHSYGFMDKAFFWLMAFIVSQAAIMLLGLTFRAVPRANGPAGLAPDERWRPAPAVGGAPGPRR